MKTSKLPSSLLRKSSGKQPGTGSGKAPPAEREAYRFWWDRPSGYPEKEIPTKRLPDGRKEPPVAHRRIKGTFSPRSGGSAALYDDQGIRYDID